MKTASLVANLVGQAALGGLVTLMLAAEGISQEANSTNDTSPTVRGSSPTGYPGPDDRAAREASILATIDQLSADSFLVREKATVRLLQIGQEAVDSLRAQLPLLNREARGRASGLLARIERESFEQASAAFLTEIDPSVSYALPAWQTFRECVGHSRASKLLFIEAVREQRRLMQMIDVYAQSKRQDKSAQDEVFERALRALAETTAAQIEREQLARLPVSLGDCVALLLAAAAIEGETPQAVSIAIDTNVQQYMFSSALERKSQGVCLRRLLSAWIPRTHQSIAPRVMQFSLVYDIPAAVKVARKNLNPARDLLTRCEALKCLARFGDESDLPLIQTAFGDHDLLHRLHPDDLLSQGAAMVHETLSLPPGMEAESIQPNSGYEVRVCDLALAAAVTIVGDNPAEYFPGYQTLGKYGVDTRSLAVPTAQPELRRKSFERFAQRQDAESKTP
ncbi:MAG TPA: hypothetical protein DDW52_15460 [Planctomycetaceae bacterium]|nr:hypothetical protein [Planctomycetaceae bacterium]